MTTFIVQGIKSTSRGVFKLIIQAFQAEIKLLKLEIQAFQAPNSKVSDQCLAVGHTAIDKL